MHTDHTYIQCIHTGKRTDVPKGMKATDVRLLSVSNAHIYIQTYVQIMHTDHTYIQCIHTRKRTDVPKGMKATDVRLLSVSGQWMFLRSYSAHYEYISS
jgi:hypothetical protein